MLLLSLKSYEAWLIVFIVSSIGLATFWMQSTSARPKHDPTAIQSKHLSSAKGDLPVPHQESKQQTGLLVSELDKDGSADFVISYRVAAPALVWFRRKDRGWDRYVIEKDFLTVEAGGAAYDIDVDARSGHRFGCRFPEQTTVVVGESLPQLQSQAFLGRDA